MVTVCRLIFKGTKNREKASLSYPSPDHQKHFQQQNKIGSKTLKIFTSVTTAPIKLIGLVIGVTYHLSFCWILCGDRPKDGAA